MHFSVTSNIYFFCSSTDKTIFFTSRYVSYTSSAFFSHSGKTLSLLSAVGSLGELDLFTDPLETLFLFYFIFYFSVCTKLFSSFLFFLEIFHDSLLDRAQPTTNSAKQQYSTEVKKHTKDRSFLLPALAFHGANVFVVDIHSNVSVVVQLLYFFLPFLFLFSCSYIYFISIFLLSTSLCCLCVVFHSSRADFAHVWSSQRVKVYWNMLGMIKVIFLLYLTP